jgi:CMP-N-acetylneuraminic acid synthetase
MSTLSNGTIGFIFARGGSKGLPGKNLLKLQGQSLLERAIRCAQAVQRIDLVVVSTDDPAIEAEALTCGATVPFRRPATLSTDNAPEWLAWRHAVEWAQSTYGIDGFNRFVSIPATAPLRSPEDIDACINLFEASDCDAVITITEGQRNPYFNMVRMMESGLIEIALRQDIQIAQRQAAPEIFDITTVAYVVAPSFIMQSSRLMDGRIKGIPIPKERAVDIDDIWDFRMAEVYMRHKDSHRESA